MINAIRIEAGVPPLKVNNQLAESARRYAVYMAKSNFFGHVGPDGSTLVTRNHAAGYLDAEWLGENIAAGYFSPEAVVAAWMKSIPHKSNILDPNFSEVGVANVSVKGSHYGRYWAQEFGRKNGAYDPAKTVTPKPAGTSGRVVNLTSNSRGVVSAGGLQGKVSMAVAGPSVPVISNLSPMRVSYGDIVTITGKSFGSRGTVRFGGLVANIVSWTDTIIKAKVPQRAISSGVTVASREGIISRGVGLTIAR
jgi:hypothetical protein